MTFEVLACFSNTHHFIFCCSSFFSHIIWLTILSNYQMFIGSTSFNNLHRILLHKVYPFNHIWWHWFLSWTQKILWLRDFQHTQKLEQIKTRASLNLSSTTKHDNQSKVTKYAWKILKMNFKPCISWKYEIKKIKVLGHTSYWCWMY
jgi:hypothetical protein